MSDRARQPAAAAAIPAVAGDAATNGSFPRRQLLLFALLLVVAVWLAHATDRRGYDSDAAWVLGRSVALVQDGRFVYAGQPAYQDLTLGPLAHLLGALPLLVSRDPHADYYFCSLLLAISVVIYYFASRQLAAAGSFAPLATAIYAAAMLSCALPISPLDWRFSPPFVALFFYFLVRSSGDRAWSQAGLWIAIGLCMQLQLSTAILAPAALTARPPRDRRDWLGVGVGIAVLLALNAHLGPQLLTLIGRTGQPGDGGFRWCNSRSWPELLLVYAQAPASLFGAAIPIVALLSLVDWRTPERRTRFRPLFRALSVQYACALVLFPLFNSFKSNLHLHYYEPSVVLWAALAASFIDSSWAAGASRRRRIVGAAAWTGLAGTVLIGLAGAVGADAPGTPDCRAMTQLEDQIALARRVNQTIVRADLNGVWIVSSFFRPDESDGLFYSPNWAPLCRRAAPELADRFAPDATRRRATLHLVARRAPPSPPRAAEDCVDARLLDRFRVGELYVAVCLAPGNELRLPPPRVAGAPHEGRRANRPMSET